VFGAHRCTVAMDSLTADYRRPYNTDSILHNPSCRSILVGQVRLRRMALEEVAKESREAVREAMARLKASREAARVLEQADRKALLLHQVSTPLQPLWRGRIAHQRHSAPRAVAPCPSCSVAHGSDVRWATLTGASGVTPWNRPAERGEEGGRGEERIHQW
jgi:hypothetical protein